MKFKRILSALLTLTLLLSCICIFASAESESYTGVYKGYNYYCSGNVTKSSCSVYMSYSDTSASIMTRSTYTYKITGNTVKTGVVRTTEKHIIHETPRPTDLVEFCSLTPEFFISGNSILRFHLGV